MQLRTTYTKGVSFVEVLITAAIIALIFGTLMGSFRFMLILISQAKAESGALALANERLEYVRSLSYDAVGTVSGIPNGNIPQNSTTTLNGLTYYERVLVEYVDAPEDGTGASDSNGILSDFKRVKVEYEWDHRGSTSSLSLVTNVVPRGIETTAGGGTLTVNVFDATVQPIQGIDVRVYNDTTTTTIDVTRETNVDGVAMFSGAPAAANYQVFVNESGYSSDQSYSTASITNPNTPHPAVIESEVSTLNFQVDQLSNLNVSTVGIPTNAAFTDDFADDSLIATSTDVDIAGGEIELAGVPGTYASSGIAIATTTSPATVASWNYLDFTGTTTASTSYVVQLYEVTGTSTYSLIPDSALSGNSIGFGAGPVSLLSVSATSYPAVAIGVTLSSTDVNETPQIGDWIIEYTSTEPQIPSVPFSLQGNKTLGTNAGLQPVYKYHASHTTDGTGDIDLLDLEWDTYEIALDTSSYDIAEACGGMPFTLDPNVSDTLKLILDSDVANTLRVHVVDSNGDDIINADVDVSRTGFSDGGTTSVCGQVFFNSGLTAASDYDVDVSASGYSTESISSFAISGDTELVVTLTP